MNLGYTVRDMHQRTARLIGEAGLCALYQKRVLVAGIGGVGAACALTLARSGIGRLTLVDFDTVSESNLNRQWVAFRSTLGRRKAEVAVGMIADIDPAIEAVPLCVKVDEGNAAALIAGHDMVVDAIDDMAAKVALAQAATQAQIPIVCSMGAGNRLDPTRFRVCDLFSTSADPLARAMRKACRAKNIGNLAVVWSDEPPIAVAPDISGLRTPASIATVPPAAGLALAAHVISVLKDQTADNL